MASVWGYREFLRVIRERPSVRSGLVVDTNVLVSATYDADRFFDQTTEFLDLVVENEVPLFCNVNVRMEFLEIHRRIIFTEALLDFSSVVDKALLPTALLKSMHSWSTRNEKLQRDGKAPLRLGEADLKSAKFELSKISDGTRDLWTVLCADRIGNKLSKLWERAAEELGLNFLSLRKEDQPSGTARSPEWAETMKLVEQEGLSSSDAAIVNAYLTSGYDAFLTSDQEVALTIRKVAGAGKGCFVPDQILKSLESS